MNAALIVCLVRTGVAVGLICGSAIASYYGREFLSGYACALGTFYGMWAVDNWRDYRRGRLR